MALPDGAEAALRRERYEDVRDYLQRHSGLPGPRSNLELLARAGQALSPAHADRLRREDSEYLRCCGVIRLGHEYLDAPSDDARDAIVGLLTRFAADASWRVREAVAMAGQTIGDHDATALKHLVRAWINDTEPLVVRAGIATICEPRLLRGAGMAAFAVGACRTATDQLLALDPKERARADARTLRQALGYCWSVAIAADPTGLPAFTALGGDPDVEWIVRENRRKARLKKLLDS
jgi:HEAT repeat protein